ncbi:MAG TPA: COX15/CtaA family protein [Microbacteriaceae bacterium]|nr:COX15/CtaA family protein [Microbacteriaceae bacterium]
MSADLSTPTRARLGRGAAGAPRSVRVAGWVSLVTEILIIGTGGAVRLTGSGLGCKWPLCAPDSLVPVPGMSFHSYVEFGNRMMSGVVGLAALAVLLLVWRMRKERRDLFTLAWIVIGGVLLQALMGGVTVLSHLNYDVVGSHFLISMILIIVAAVFVARAPLAPGPRRWAAPRWIVGMTHTAAVLTALTLILGVVTSESGPHSGNADVRHHLFNAVVMAHVHSGPAYALLAVSIVLVIGMARARLRPLGWSIGLLVLLLIQIPLGIYQARDGLPAVAIESHMLLAALITATMAILVMRLRVPAAAPGPEAPTTQDSPAAAPVR